MSRWLSGNSPASSSLCRNCESDLPCPRICPLIQASMTVLPVPRGPNITRSGAAPPRRRVAAKSSPICLCSSPLPARYGGESPAPGVNGLLFVAEAMTVGRLR